MGLVSKYNPADVEGKWYQYWLDRRLLSSKPDGHEPYTIITSPLNVTSMLHTGHMPNNTTQSILVHRAHMGGKNACWVSGADHASIATEAKVMNKLAAQGIKKADLTRGEFLKHAWVWTNERGGVILRQLRKLGASCDWDCTTSTMDEKCNGSVLKVFVDLYKEGPIYHGVCMVNRDPEALTALSNEEVTYKEEHGKLYYLRYKTGDEDSYAVVVTTHPETIMGDAAMCINPNDLENQHLKGKKVTVPLIGRVIPMIEGDCADIEFGTGCLKVTPARDVNDYMLGEKYNSLSIDIFNDNRIISEAAGMYIGTDRFEVRKQIEEDFEAAGLPERTEAHTNKVGYFERTNVVVEPKLSIQRSPKMEHLAQITFESVMKDEIKFYPARCRNTYRHWMENIKNWCISRQLRWGYCIPAYFLPEGGYIVAVTDEGVLKSAEEKAGNDRLAMADPRQDEDCLDTRFPSWPWPISLFDGINNPGNEEINHYYPTSDLVIGPDTIFFWMARMVMAGYECEGKMPFKNVYFTGIIHDKLGCKMSKSLGDSPDPLESVEKYGTDDARMGMILSAPTGDNILFDDAPCKQGRNFCNKIWNAFRLVKGWENGMGTTDIPVDTHLTVQWFDQKLDVTAVEVVDLFSKCRLSGASMLIYKLFWSEFSSRLFEIVRPTYGQSVNGFIYSMTLSVFEHLLAMLHPSIPFIMEELWQQLRERELRVGLMVEPLTEVGEVNEEFLKQFETAKEITSSVRAIRLQKNTAMKEPFELQVVGANPVEKMNPVIFKIRNLSAIQVVDIRVDGASSLTIGTTESTVPLDNMIDVEIETARMKAELKHKGGFLQGVLKKLSNEELANNAPAAVIEMGCKEQVDAEGIIKSLKESTAPLKSA